MLYSGYRETLMCYTKYAMSFTKGQHARTLIIDATNQKLE